MKRVLPKFEHRAQAVVSPRRFIIRLAHSGIIALALVVVSLVIGMIGYRVLEGVSWIDAFLNASMLLGGMGPVTIPVTFGGKLFAGLYALYCGLAVILVAGIILAPVAHRILHTFRGEPRSMSSSCITVRSRKVLAAAAAAAAQMLKIRGLFAVWPAAPRLGK